MRQIMQFTTLTTLLLLTLSLPAVFALDEPNGSGRRNGPPTEAIEACNGKNIGDQVSFETPRGDIISGICREHEGQLFAVPKNGRGMRGKPGPRGEQPGEQ